MAKRHLTVDEIDQIAQRAHLGPQRRQVLAATLVPAAMTSHQVVDSLIDIERTVTALARHVGAPRVTELRRYRCH